MIITFDTNDIPDDYCLSEEVMLDAMIQYWNNRRADKEKPFNIEVLKARMGIDAYYQDYDIKCSLISMLISGVLKLSDCDNTVFNRETWFLYHRNMWDTEGKFFFSLHKHFTGHDFPEGLNE